MNIIQVKSQRIEDILSLTEIQGDLDFDSLAKGRTSIIGPIKTIFQKFSRLNNFTVNYTNILAVIIYASARGIDTTNNVPGQIGHLCLEALGNYFRENGIVDTKLLSPHYLPNVNLQTNLDTILMLDIAGSTNNSTRYINALAEQCKKSKQELLCEDMQKIYCTIIGRDYQNVLASDKLGIMGFIATEQYLYKQGIIEFTPFAFRLYKQGRIKETQVEHSK